MHHQGSLEAVKAARSRVKRPVRNRKAKEVRQIAARNLKVRAVSLLPKAEAVLIRSRRAARSLAVLVTLKSRPQKTVWHRRAAVEARALPRSLNPQATRKALASNAVQKRMASSANRLLRVIRNPEANLRANQAESLRVASLALEVVLREAIRAVVRPAAEREQARRAAVRGRRNRVKGDLRPVTNLTASLKRLLAKAAVRLRRSPNRSMLRTD